MSENHNQLVTAIFHVADRNDHIAKLEAEVNRLRSLVKSLEWVRSDSQDWRSCRVCRQFEEHGHADDCALAAALKEDGT